MPYIANLMPGLFWTDAMFVNAQRIISGEYTGEQAGENAATVTQRWAEQNPDLVENYSSLLTELPALLRRWLAERGGGALQGKKRGWFSRQKAVERRDEP